MSRVLPINRILENVIKYVTPANFFTFDEDARKRIVKVLVDTLYETVTYKNQVEPERTHNIKTMIINSIKHNENVQNFELCALLQYILNEINERNVSKIKN